MPATAKLLATIATLPHGAVVLPGLDTDLDAATWELIGGTPENALPRLRPSAACDARAAAAHRHRARRGGPARRRPARGRVVSEAMRPSAATERWAERIEAATRDAALADDHP